jgi:hypothetical protein
VICDTASFAFAGSFARAASLTAEYSTDASSARLPLHQRQALHAADDEHREHEPDG